MHHGGVETSGVLLEHDINKENMQKRHIGPVKVLWENVRDGDKTTRDGSDAAVSCVRTRRVLVWVHPACEKDAKEILEVCFMRLCA